MENDCQAENEHYKDHEGDEKNDSCHNNRASTISRFGHSFSVFIIVKLVQDFYLSRMKH